MDQAIYPIIIKFLENIDKTLRALKPFLESTFDIPLERYSTLSTSFVIQEYSRATSRLIWQWILEKHNASKLCKFNVASSPGIETMRKIASWISRAPFPYSPQGDETIRYILYGVSRTFSSYCRILDSKGLFPSWIQLCRVYVSSNTFEIVPSQLLPPFFSSSSDFSRGNKQYSQRCWRVNRRFYDDSWHKKKERKREKKFEETSITFRIIRHSQTCKQRRNTCCCKFHCEFPQRELTRLFSYVMSPVWTFDTTVWFR